MTLSLCMIVRNEEHTLSRCLDSVKDCFDEIIILDTGSIDRTCEIAAAYTPHIYHMVWENNFSLARNQAFSYATCDYIIWLDADDVLTEENRKKLLHLKHHIDETVDVYHMYYATAFNEDDSPTFYYLRERMVRRNIPHRWIGAVHEVLECGGAHRTTDIFIYHKSIKKEYTNRNLLIYEGLLKAEGYLKPRDQYYYARELYYHGRYEDAITAFQRYLYSGVGWIENRIDAYLVLSKCYEQLLQTKKALCCLYMSFSERPPNQEISCEIGRLLMKEKQYANATRWFQIAISEDDFPLRDSGAFINTDYEKYIPCLQLCVCFDKLSMYEKAYFYHKIACEIRPNSPSVQYNQKYFAWLEQKGFLRNMME